MGTRTGFAAAIATADADAVVGVDVDAAAAPFPSPPAGARSHPTIVDNASNPIDKPSERRGATTERSLMDVVSHRP
jgi:hypothetical protein